MAKLDRAVPWIVSVILLTVYLPGLARSHLTQGDLPGHLESIRWSAEHIWPLPWGWDPRYLLGAPLGVLYPPLLTWAGAFLAQGVGAEWALRILLGASVVVLPPCLAAAARGFGLRSTEAAFSAAVGTAILWLPGPGLGGTFRQTFVAGNAANAVALPLFLLFLARMRFALAGRCRPVGAACLLSGVLLGHFLLGAAAGTILAAYGFAGALRGRHKSLLRAVGIGGVALLLAAPFLVPFLVHFREASPDGIPYSPLPRWIEWAVLAGLGGAVFLGGRRARRALAPGFVLAAAFLAVRGIVFPVFGHPPFRMEYHRFRLLLYLAAVPAAALVLENLRGRRETVRMAGRLALAGIVVLALVAPYDARGPAPVPLPGVPGGRSSPRILVLASPDAQNGAWHALQLEAPVTLGVEGAKGLFVEASPFARAVFEVEQAAAGPDALPRWWGIRVSPTGNWTEVELAARLAGLGVGAVLAREPVSDRLLALASSREPVGEGFRWIRLREGLVGGSGDWAALPPVPSAALPARGVGVTDVARNAAGDRVSVRFAAGTTGRAVLLTFAHSDWAIESGSGRLYRVPLDPRAGIMAPLLGLEGTGTIVLSHRPRSEEWAGLAIGLLTALAVAARTITRRRREAR